jgi:hypothetical protein
VTFDTTAETEVMEDEAVPLCGDRRNQLVNGITGAIADASAGELTARELIGEALLLDPSIIIDVAMALETAAPSIVCASNRRLNLNRTLARACRKLGLNPPYRVRKRMGRVGRRLDRDSFVLERRVVSGETPEYRRLTYTCNLIRRYHAAHQVTDALIALGWTPPRSIGDSK